MSKEEEYYCRICGRENKQGRIWNIWWSLRRMLG